MSFNQKCDTILSIVNYYRPALPIVIHDHYPRQKLVTFLDCSIIPYLRSSSPNPAVKDFNKVKFVPFSKPSTNKIKLWKGLF